MALKTQHQIYIGLRNNLRYYFEHFPKLTVVIWGIFFCKLIEYLIISNNVTHQNVTMWFNLKVKFNNFN